MRQSGRVSSESANEKVSRQYLRRSLHDAHLADARKVFGHDAVKRLADRVVLLDERVEEVDFVCDAFEEEQRIDGIRVGFEV